MARAVVGWGCGLSEKARGRVVEFEIGEGKFIAGFFFFFLKKSCLVDGEMEGG